MDKNLTDSEIVKALECRVKDKCPECPYFHSYPCDKCRKMQTDALDYINRLQAQNDELFETVDYRLEQILKLEDNLKTAKAEAYKEFAERLKKQFSLGKKECRKFLDNDGAFAYDKARKIVDNLLKEMVGEDNESKN